MRHRDAGRGEDVGTTDPRQLEELRRIDRAGRQDHFVRGPHLMALSPRPIDEAGAAPPIEHQLLHLRIGAHREVGAGRHRPQERLGGIPADAAPLVDLEVAHAEVVAAVEIVGARNAALHAGFDERVQQVPAQSLRLHPPLAARAMELAGAAIVILGTTEQRQHRLPPPAGVAGGLRPPVVVLALPAHIDHAVDRGAAAEHAAARIEELPAVEARLRSRAVAPVGARIADAVEVPDRDVDPVVVVAAARLEQQHPRCGIGREPVREQAAGRSCPHDHVVEGLHAPPCYARAMRSSAAVRACSVRSPPSVVDMPPLRALALAASLLLAACAGTRDQTPPADLQAQVTRAEQAFAMSMADRDHAAFAGTLCADAVFFTGPAPLVGKPAVEAANDVCDCPKAS